MTRNIRSLDKCHETVVEAISDAKFEYQDLKFKNEKLGEEMERQKLEDLKIIEEKSKCKKKQTTMRLKKYKTKVDSDLECSSHNDKKLVETPFYNRALLNT